MSAENPPENPFNGAPLVPGNPGNSGGKKGRSGRPPEWFKDMCRQMIASPKARTAVKAIIENPNHPHFASMWRAVSDRGYGKAEQPIHHAGHDGGPMSFTLNLGAASVSDG